MSPSTPVRVRALPVAVVAALAFAALVLGAGPASAHARLVSITPADGSTVATPPTQIALTFNEDLLATSVRIEVLDGEGVPVAKGKPVVEGPTATQPLVSGLSAGGYSVAYRVVSKDGHPISGRATFTAKAGATATTIPTPPPTSTTATPTSPSITSPLTTSTSPPPTTPVGTLQPSDVPGEVDDSAGLAWGWILVGVAAAGAVAAALVLLLRGKRRGGGRHAG